MQDPLNSSTSTGPVLLAARSIKQFIAKSDKKSSNCKISSAQVLIYSSKLNACSLNLGLKDCMFWHLFKIKRQLLCNILPLCLTADFPQRSSFTSSFPQGSSGGGELLSHVITLSALVSKIYVTVWRQFLGV